MVKFVPIDPNDVSDVRYSRRGRVSYPILKQFLETGEFLVRLDRAGMEQSVQSLSSSLRSYIINHKLPIKMFQRGGEIHLMRLDINEDGDPVEDWEKYAMGNRSVSKEKALKAEFITPETVAKRAQEED